MAIIGEDNKMSVHHGKTSIQGRQALYAKLQAGNKVALEAGNMAFIMTWEIMERKGCQVLVLNSAKLPFIWDAPTKTDKEDAMKLVHLIEERRDERLPLGWYRGRANKNFKGRRYWPATGGKCETELGI